MTSGRRVSSQQKYVKVFDEVSTPATLSSESQRRARDHNNIDVQVTHALGDDVLDREAILAARHTVLEHTLDQRDLVLPLTDVRRSVQLGGGVVKATTNEL